MADGGVAMEMDSTNSGGQEMTAEFMTQLISNLQNQMDLSARLQSVKELGTIATAIGPRRTREELLPFLIGCIDEDDEVADAICDELVKFGPLVGGVQFIQVLLPPLEAIAAGEEVVTRQKAVNGLATLAKQMQVANMLNCMLPMIERLLKGHWFAQRASACGLIHIVYPVSEPLVQRQLLEWLKSLCTDQAAMVRRSVAENLEFLIPMVDKALLSELVHPMFLLLSQDEQDSVRLLAGKLCIVMAKALTYDEVRQAVLPPLQSLIKDPAWRVRYVIADNFCGLQTVVGPDMAKSELLPAFIQLLADTESEVRAAAAVKVVDFLKELPADVRVDAVLKGALPKLQLLVVDEAQHVRCALASVIMGLAEIIGKEHTISFLLPLFLTLLKDQFSDVRLKIISNLDSVNKVVGLDQLAQALEPAINELFTDENWRVRIAIIELIPLVAKQLGVDYFNQELSTKFLDSLLDRIFSVRAATIDNIAKLVEYFGVDWAKTSLLPRILGLPGEKNTYAARLVTLLAINRLVEVCPKDVIEGLFVPVVCACSRDKVANVRFNVGKVLEKMIPLVEKGVYENHISKVLESSISDPDVDVRFHGTRAKNVAIQVFP